MFSGEATLPQLADRSRFGANLKRSVSTGLPRVTIWHIHCRWYSANG